MLTKNQDLGPNLLNLQDRWAAYGRFKIESPILKNPSWIFSFESMVQI